MKNSILKLSLISLFNIVLYGSSCEYEKPLHKLNDSRYSYTSELCYDSHYVYYDKNKKVPLLVEYKYNKHNFRKIDEINNAYDREDFKFKIEKGFYLLASEQNRPSHYKGTAYDKGHLAPYFLTGKSDIEKENVNKMTNIAPQRAYLNRVCWQKEEQNIRKRVRDNNENLTVLVGIVFNEDDEKIKIVKKLQIPSYFFMVIQNDITKKKNIVFIRIRVSKMENVQIFIIRLKKNWKTY